MTPLQDLAIVAAGVLAGAMNTVVGSGTLVTFPVLLALGFPPVTANVSNAIGLVPGAATGALGYRRELAGQRARLLALGVAALLGGAGGAVLLLWLPSSAFNQAVPVLIGIAVLLVVLQPWLKRRFAQRQAAPDERGGVGLWLGVFAVAVYGGYFGAAQGVLFLSLMGIMINDSLQRLNAVKIVLALLAKVLASILFIAIADVAWFVVLLLTVGTLAGGWVGARVGRKLSPVVMRVVIVVIGIAAIVDLLL